MVNKKLKKSLYALLGMGILSMNLSTQIEATEVNSVENKADFSTDTIYQVITDRFSDGNIQNNPTGAILIKVILESIMVVIGKESLIKSMMFI